MPKCAFPKLFTPTLLYFYRSSIAYEGIGYYPSNVARPVAAWATLVDTPEPCQQARLATIANKVASQITRGKAKHTEIPPALEQLNPGDLTSQMLPPAPHEATLNCYAGEGRFNPMRRYSLVHYGYLSALICRGSI